LRRNKGELAADRRPGAEPGKGQGMRFPVIGLRVALFALLIAFGVAGGFTADGRAQAAQLSTIVVDMRDGTVYHAAHADRRQHPASLTKMMTLYLTFEAVRDGRISLD